MVGGGYLSVGQHVDIAQETIIWTESHDPNNEFHATVDRHVKIEDHVWIGCRAMIMPGVTLHQGCVVGAGSIVTKDVSKKTIVAGIPARKISERDNPLKYQLHYYNYFK